MPDADRYRYRHIAERNQFAPVALPPARFVGTEAAGIDTEFHHYPQLGHGFGLGVGTTAEGWIDDATAFWAKHIEP